MRVKSTNLAKPINVNWRGKQITTGIYKFPVEGPVYLDSDSVREDIIADRRVHGGSDKACYLFSADHYPYWQEKYAGLEWDWGMFGENLTVEGLNEESVYLGDIYEIGTALVEVSQPREPCFKLGIRFGNQGILRQFIDHGYPGTYVRILRQGQVTAGDSFRLVERPEPSISIRDFFLLLFAGEKDQEILEIALQLEALPQKKRDKLQKYKKGGY